jgi:5-(carboxyamino)imidazole ribonucleotide synthase
MQTDLKLGILGGGQLGRMMQEAAFPLNIQLQFLDPSEQAPCSIFKEQFTIGDWKRAETVSAFGQNQDVIGLEFEDVSIKGLEALEEMGKTCIPSSNLLRIIQDKSKQKIFLQESGIPTLPFLVVESAADLSVDYPYMLKKTKGGYDGYGVKKIKAASDIPRDWEGPYLVEPICQIEKEIAVLVARNEKGETTFWEPVEMVFNPKTHMVEHLISPGNIAAEIRLKAIEIALECAGKLNSVGILAVEMFLGADGHFYVNEMAPRPHNSGHWTIEGSVTSQFEQYVRILSGLPMGQTSSTGFSATLNILGAEHADGASDEGSLRRKLAEIPWAKLHLYGKKQVKPNRKMGHLTIVAKTAQELHHLLTKIPYPALRISSLPSKS